MKQVIAVTTQSLQAIPQRWSTSIVTIVGVAGVVAVFVAMLSMATGFKKTMENGVDDANVVILRDGSSSELDSGLSNEQVNLIEQAPGLASNGEGPLSSAELYVVVDLKKKSTGTDANVPMRGVGPQAMAVRDNIEIIDGRMFEPGKAELIAGRGAASQFQGLAVGSVLRFGQAEWTVVGHFSANGGAAESELWTDVKVLQPAYRRGNSFQSVYARLSSADALTEFSDALSTDPRLSVEVMRERDYYAGQSQALSGFITGIGYTIAILMALGAIFGTVNTMYSAVSERSREIATLKALGFGGLSIVVSVLVEALVLAIIGGALGGGLAWLIFNGFTVSTLNFSGFSQVVFAFAVTPGLLIQGIVMAVTIGLLAGFFPAVRAASKPVSAALRDL